MGKKETKKYSDIPV